MRAEDGGVTGAACADTASERGLQPDPGPQRLPCHLRPQPKGASCFGGLVGSGSGLHQQARNVTQIQEVGRGAPATSTGPVLTLHFRTLALQGHTGSQNICKDSDMAKDREVAVALDFF